MDEHDPKKKPHPDPLTGGAGNAPVGRDWNRYKGTSRRTWEEAREAARDSWNRIRGTT